MSLKKSWTAALDTFPWKRKGYKVLEKYDTARPADGDHAVLAQMAAHGVDFSRERHVVHYLYFTDDAGRASVELSLRENHYATRHGADASGDKPRSLIAERTGLVNEKIVEEERRLLSGIAEANGGEYDGWEAALD
jgi:hypothetical protein